MSNAYVIETGDQTAGIVIREATASASTVRRGGSGALTDLRTEGRTMPKGPRRGWLSRLRSAALIIIRSVKEPMILIP